MYVRSLSTAQQNALALYGWKLQGISIENEAIVRSLGDGAGGYIQIFLPLRQSIEYWLNRMDIEQ